jgi:hypothetical protein
VDRFEGSEHLAHTLGVALLSFLRIFLNVFDESPHEPINFMVIALDVIQNRLGSPRNIVHAS